MNLAIQLLIGPFLVLASVLLAIELGEALLPEQLPLPGLELVR